MPHELLLKAARGEPLGGAVPTIAQQLAAARQAAPYYAARLSPKRGDDGQKELVVMLQRFAGGPEGEELYRMPIGGKGEAGTE